MEDEMLSECQEELDELLKEEGIHLSAAELELAEHDVVEEYGNDPVREECWFAAIDEVVDRLIKKHKAMQP
jgi:hypothetical protein